jgi:hypothetical protein
MQIHLNEVNITNACLAIYKYLLYIVSRMIISLLIEIKPWSCRYCGLDESVDSLASQYVQKLGMIIKRSTHELDLDDQASVRMWAEKNKKSVFFYQDSTDSDPFILGIQTEWQLQQMIRFGHQSLLACDSSFGISKLKVFYFLWSQE